MLRKVAALAAVLLVAFSVMMLTTRNTTFTVERTLVLKAPPARIWETLTDVNSWPDWWPGIEEAKLSPDWRQGAVLDLILKGNPGKTPAKIEVFRPMEQIAWERPGVLGSTTRTILSLNRDPKGTIVSLESALRGPQAFLAGITGRDSFGNYQAMVLEALRNRLEGGQDAGEP